MSYRILVIEDELDIQEPMVAFLEMEKYNVTTANDGLEGIQLFQKGNYDLIILDVMMPKVNGYEVCRMIREKNNIPIIMLTALGEEQDQIKGFDLGIDDYIIKPFSLTLFLKRVKALFKRTYEEKTTAEIYYKDLTIHLENHTLHIDSKQVELTAKEFAILSRLMLYPGKVVTREELMDQVWGYDFAGDTLIINTHIKNIRKKINRNYIKTVTNVGYKLDA